MANSEEEKSLIQEVSDRVRKVIQKGKEVLVPLKFDDRGELLTQDTFDIQKHFKRLSMDDLRFLQAWRKAEWNVQVAIKNSAVSDDKAERLIKKLQIFRDEDAQVKALAEIPTTAWIQAKHVENVYNGGQLEDSERDSLKELAKMSGAYKTSSTVNIQTNIFQMPQLSPEAMVKLKEFADSQADVVEGEVV